MNYALLLVGLAFLAGTIFGLAIALLVTEVSDYLRERKQKRQIVVNNQRALAHRREIMPTIEEGFKKLHPDVVMKITVQDVSANRVTLDIRIRGEENWLFFNNVVLVKHGEILVSDNQEKDSSQEHLDFLGLIYEKLPRSEAIEGV